MGRASNICCLRQCREWQHQRCQFNCSAFASYLPAEALGEHPDNRHPLACSPPDRHGQAVSAYTVDTSIQLQQAPLPVSQHPKELYGGGAQRTVPQRAGLNIEHAVQSTD